MSCLMHLFDKYFVILVKRVYIWDVRGVPSLSQAVNKLFLVYFRVLLQYLTDGPGDSMKFRSKTEHFIF